MATRTHDRKVADDVLDPAALIQEGDALRERAEYARAETCLRQAIEILEHTRGRKHLELAIALNSLGVLYKYVGCFAAGRRAYMRALRIVEQAASAAPDQPEFLDFLASLYHNLGGLEHARGRFTKGEPLARQAVALRRMVRDADDPVVAADEAALAALLDGQGKYDEAEALYVRALAIFERFYGPEHYEVAVSLNNLAAIYHMRGDPYRAEPLYRRALAIKEMVLGKQHPDTAMTLINLAILQGELNKPIEADRCFRRALTIIRQSLPDGHPKLLAAEQNYQQFCQERKRGRT